MRVLKRNGSYEPVRFDKITSRIKKQTYDLDRDYVEAIEVSQKVIAGLYDGVTSKELDRLAAETAASLTRIHPDYSLLAARLAITSLKKETNKSFKETINKLYHYVNEKTGENASLISDEVYNVVQEHSEKIESMIVHDRDFNFDYFGFKTLERAYLLKVNGEIVETPQHMYMRVAIGIWGDNLKEVQKTYELLSTGYFTHATPTLFNAGTKKPQLSSCFLIDIDDDSIQGIYKTLSDCAAISQSAGGIGLNIHKIRAKGSYIKGTNGYSNGILPMLKVFNETARYVDQCFTPETEIRTDNGYKKISDLNSNDKVLTSTGDYERIIKVKKFENKNRNFKIIHTKYGYETVTDGHLYLVIKNGKLHKNIKEALISNLITPEWVPANELTTKDLLVRLNK